ncbi:HAD family phosphatase [Marinomonas piezotolerans]|uniref:HAD family phosphatase n=1 Tax=Marinomonas piezotolerans TaxID=2213058 RepID=A0A370UD30_9GAMM|nr:HAD family phosphatase [Marinomonas piezotolerans]RDL45700.1 HAD family phosphatase [Marinomonas piezotolerans]
MPYQYDAILFDCDGVIVDTETIATSILQRNLKHIGLDLDDHTMHTQFAGFTNKDNLALAEQLLGHPLPSDFAENYRQEFNETIQTSLTPIEGVPELLSKIQCPIAMATNAQTTEMELKLGIIGLSERFHTRFSVDDVAHGKPAPDLYLAAANALNIAPQHCIVIEDSLAGIQAGKAAGATVLAFSSTLSRSAQLEAGATDTFNSMQELMALLGLH